jgi:2-dehydro-3-deoxy-L-rhamnonate dehydrogenase (NAD+)
MEQHNLNNQVAIITGAASGLGFEIAKKLANLGVHLALLDISAPYLALIQANNAAKILFYKTDVSDEKAVAKGIKSVIADFGTVDILVNCAGITGKTNIKSHLVDSDDLRRVFDINFMGSYHTSKHVLPVMLQKNYGRILHIASIAGKEGNAGMLAYSASKAAVIGMAKVQGKEYAETGITVNALAPAVIKTALVDDMPEAQVMYMTDKIPMKRCGTLQEAANLVAYIVSPENSFTTGFTFDLSGGRATY